MKKTIRKITKKGERLAAQYKGWRNQNGITAYWWNRRINFGDLITPALLESYSYTPIHTKYSEASLVSTGSILQLLPENYSGYVLGSGIIEDKQHPLPNAKFLAVRGKLTQERVSAPTDIPLGDPGLLANRFLKTEPTAKYPFGFAPHYVDKESHGTKAITEKLGENVKLIDVEKHPDDVLQDISECATIISSSLHGIIVAHSLHIPTIWVRLSDKLTGGTFKFEDYASAVGYTIRPYTSSDLLAIANPESLGSAPPREEIESRKQQLDAIFTQLHQLGLR